MGQPTLPRTPKSRLLAFGAALVLACLCSGGSVRTEPNQEEKKEPLAPGIDRVVKAHASAGRADVNGKQTVTVRLTIEKGWHIFANPVESDFYREAETKLTMTSQGKISDIHVVYPPGKTLQDDSGSFKAYEDEVTITANLRRASGNGPLELSIRLQACSAEKKRCILGTIRMTVP